MKTGRTLTALAAEIERQAKEKRDFVAPTRGLTLLDTLDLKVGEMGSFGLNELAHEQIGDRLAIPRDYYQRMRSTAPGLLTTNVNHWFQNKPEQRMVRTLDGRVRAFLSERYRPLDNLDLAEAVLPTFGEMRLDVKSAEITERRLYLKATFPMIQTEIKKGDVVEAGLIISNSEVGCGALSVQPMIYRLVCTNGMIAADMGTRRNHVGRGYGGNGDDGSVSEFFTDKTRALDDAAFFSKIKDVVKAVMKQEVFDRIVNRMRAAAGDVIKGDPIKAIEVTQKRFGLMEGEKTSVLRHLIEGGDLSRYGVLNAVTRTAQDVESYDRATELERIGGKVLELPASEWKVIAEAAAA